MFIQTLNENKRNELIEKGFNLICEQDFGHVVCYTFEFKPSFYAFFDKGDMDSLFISNEMHI